MDHIDAQRAENLRLAEQVRTLREAVEVIERHLRFHAALSDECERSGQDFGRGRAVGIRDLYADIRAALSASPAPAPTSQWQPIETAPKDGTRILGFGGTIITVQWDDFENDRTKPRWIDHQCYPAFPTHRMPLPSAPADREKP